MIIKCLDRPVELLNYSPIIRWSIGVVPNHLAALPDCLFSMGDWVNHPRNKIMLNKNLRGHRRHRRGTRRKVHEPRRRAQQRPRDREMNDNGQNMPLLLHTFNNLLNKKRSTRRPSTGWRISNPPEMMIFMWWSTLIRSSSSSLAVVARNYQIMHKTWILN